MSERDRIKALLMFLSDSAYEHDERLATGELSAADWRACRDGRVRILKHMGERLEQLDRQEGCGGEEVYA